MDKKKYNQQPAMQIDAKKEYQATLRTSKGDITIKMHVDQAPITVNNFVFLAQEGFYDNTIFHRAIEGFMIQGGDPEGTGMGGPGYRFADEPFEGEYVRGVVAMANAGPDTNGSQFFIMHQDYPLPANYVIFGEVVGGLEVVDAIATAPVTVSPSGERSKPVTPVTVQSVQIVEN
jgi:cyclophilin family peptidyl-prolyl cis-trans isomerase